MHARLGSRMPESEFWMSYFYRCACLRVAVGMGGGSLNYPLIGEPLSLPVLPSNKEGEEEEGKDGVEEAKQQSSLSSSAAASKSGPSPPLQPAGAAAEGAAAAAAGEGKRRKEELEGEGGKKEEEDDDMSGSLDLDGLDLGSDDGEAGGGGQLLEGDALKELEAQIAAELDAEGL